MAASPIACGNTVAYPSRAAPCNPSLHQLYEGIPRREIGDASCTICETFSSSVMRETRSLTRSSMGSEGFRNGALDRSELEVSLEAASGVGF